MQGALLRGLLSTILVDTATAVGAILTAVATSPPEFVTTFAAVRLSRYSLAIGGIIGGNVFDTLMMAP